MTKHLFVLLSILGISMLAFAQNPVDIAAATSLRPSQGGYMLSNAYDGNTATNYEAQWSINAIPDTIDFFFTGAKSINKIAYTPRQSGPNGIWTLVDVFYTTTDAPATFVSKQANISWAANSTVKTIDMAASPIVKPYCVRLVVNAAVGNFSTCAEINFSSAETGTLPLPGADCENPTASFNGVGDSQIAIASASTNSFNSASESIEKTFDNNTATLYSAKYSLVVSAASPADLTYNFSGSNQIDYLVYTPRQDGNPNGNFGAGEIYYTNAGNQNVKLMDFDAGFSASPTKIVFPQSLVNVTSITVRVKSGGNNFATCAEMKFFKSNLAGLNLYTDIFADELHTAIKSGVTQADIDNIGSDYFRSLANCIFNNTYDKKYRVQHYDFYPVPSTVEASLKSNGLNRFENPTGIAFKANTKAVIFVGNTSGVNPILQVKDFALNDDATVDGYPLEKGINIIDIAHDGLGYISYFSNTPNLQPIQINITTGKVNGYFDPTRDTDDEWVKMLQNGVYPKLDIKGKYISLNYDKAPLISNSSFSGKALAEAYDAIVYEEYIQNGLVKYNRVPKNHMFSRSAYNGGWYASGDGIHLDLTWGESGITSAKGVTIDPWGIAHELGHNNQVRPGAKWIGMTEVTNNVNSAWVQYKYGKAFPNATRLEKDFVEPKAGMAETAAGRYSSMFYSCLIGKQNTHAQGDVFVRLVPFWQLEVYYQLAGAGKNLPTFNQRLAGTPAPTGQPDVAFWYADVLEKMRTTSQTGVNNGQLVLNFVMATCDAVQEDLTDFFVKSGYLLPIDRDIEDYSVQRMTLTQAQIDATIATIKSKGYPQPVSPVLNYISANTINAYQNPVAVNGQNMQGVTANTVTLTIDNTKWANAVAFETYSGNTLTDVAIFGTGDASNINATTTVQYPQGSTKVLAVGADGSRKQVYPADGTSSLPVGLVDFSASLKNDGALLQWKTSSEQNNKAFEIYKSEDGKTFNKIGEIAGKGTTAHVSNYQFVDAGFFKSAYYKLVQIDADGKRKSYDELVRYVPSLKSNVTLLYPNPATRSFYIRNKVDGPFQLTISDMNGRLVKKQSLGTANAEVGIADLVPGVYTVQITTKNGLETKKLVKK